MPAVTDPEWIDVLPAVVKHLPLHAVGNLRRTCRALRVLPCILAVPTSVLSRENVMVKLLDTRASCRVCHDSAVSTWKRPSFSLRCTASAHTGQHQLFRQKPLFFRPLQDLGRLRRLELKLGGHEALSCLGKLTQLTSLLVCGQ